MEARGGPATSGREPRALIVAPLRHVLAGIDCCAPVLNSPRRADTSIEAPDALLGLADLEDLRATDRARAARRWLSILHGNGLGIADLPLSPAFHTVCFQ